MALIGPTYKGINLDIVTPFQNANERDYIRFRDANKNIQEGMKALGTGIGDARKYFERKDALKELGANDAEIARLEKMLKDLDVEIANTKTGINAASNANIGLKKWNEIPRQKIQGGPYPYSNNLLQNEVYGGEDYEGRFEAPKFGSKSGLI